MLNLPALMTAATGMDQYGFFTIAPLAVWPFPLVSSLVLGVSSAGVGYLAYCLLQKRRWLAGRRYETYHHNAVVFGTPVAIAFLPSFLLAGLDYKPLALGVAGIMAPALCLTAALNDREARLDAEMARILFVVCAAIILVLLMLSVLGMQAMYFVQHSPSSGNFFWSWKFAWSDLGYPAEEFSERHRNGLIAFGVSATFYMTAALGSALLGAILSWTKPVAAEENGSTTMDDAPAFLPVRSPTDWSNYERASQEDPLVFVQFMNGEGTNISRSRYENILADKTSCLPGAQLLVDNVVGTAFTKNHDRWEKIPFRGRQKGPFLLLCFYARYPGRRFTASELEIRLESRLSNRNGFNVSDLVTQLRKKGIPVDRDDVGTYIPAEANICFLDHLTDAAVSAPEP